MNVSDLKRDGGLLLAVLDLRRAGSQRCPFHDDKKSSFDVYQRDGVWFWKCFGQCAASGTIIDAAMRVYRAPDCRAALQAIERELGIKIGQDEALQEPVIDLARAERFIDDGTAKLEDPDVQRRYAIGKRGFHDQGWLRALRVGFCVRAGFAGKSWRATGWILPITVKGKLVAVKLHCEERPWADGPKCLWAPFGTMPAEKPRHGLQTLWPEPELFPNSERLFLCPGELKALAYLCAGAHATSPTAGESAFPARLVRRLAACKPKDVVLVYDSDAAGRKWRDALTRDLTSAGLVVAPMTFRGKTCGPPSSASAAESRFTTREARDASLNTVPAPAATGTFQNQELESTSGAAFPPMEGERAE